MKVTLAPSATSARAGARSQYLTTFLVNDRLAIDAGSLGFLGTAQEQARVRHVLISHSHIDHVASLPIFLENVYEGGSDCVTVYGSEPVLDSLQHDIFNNRVWPDFITMSKGDKPFLKLATLHGGQPLELDGVRITPVPVDHAVPTLGFILEDRLAAVVIASDTGPTDEIWRKTNATANVRAVFLEATFPNEMAELADIAKHLTPAGFAAEVAKLQPRTPPITCCAVHLKARFHEQVERELLALRLPNVQIAQAGVTYSF